MKHVLVNDTPIAIERFQPTDVSSSIEAAGITQWRPTQRNSP